MFLSDAAIRNRTTVMVLMALIVLVGAYSYVVLPRESEPDVPIPLILINTPYEGVSPEDVESQVTIKIENELTGLKGVKEIRSTSAEGMSAIQVEFHPDVVIEDALQRVRDKVDLAKAELPTDADEPVITEINIAELPIMIVSISGAVAPIRLKEIADELEDRFEQIPGVLEVDVIGAVEREIRLEIDPDRLAAYNLTMADLLGIIPSENVNISAGGLETRGTKFNVRVPAEFVSPSEANTLVVSVVDGKPIYLTDVARVQDTFKDRESLSRLNGESNVTLNVKKRIGANIVDIANRVKAVLQEARAIVPKGVALELTDDRSKDIHMMLKDLENNILTALILVVAVLVLFMGLRTSLIVAFVIPMSMLMSFALLYMLGYTLNMIVLFSLVLALGMLVDNAIVIVENIYRYMQMGHSRVKASILGTREVAWPVITSTATTVAAFAPLIFWPGIMGDFMKYLPITVIIVLISSLFVALIINPTISSFLAAAQKRKREEDALPVRLYRRFLQTVLSSGLHRFTALFLCVALLVSLVAAYILADLGVELFPSIDPRQASVSIRNAQGTNLYESDRFARIAEGHALPYLGELNYIVTNVGSGGDFFSSSAGSHLATVRLIFRDFEDRERPSAEAVKEIRDRLTDLAGPEVTVQKEEGGPPTGSAVTIRLVGKDFKVLEEISKKLKNHIVDVPGAVNLRSDLEATRPELVFVIDRREAKLAGVDTATVGRYLQTAVFGREVGKYRDYNDEYDITLRLPLSQRMDVQDLERLYIPNQEGRPVPIRSLGGFEYRGGFGTIHRVDQKRVVTITGDAAEGQSGAEVLKRVQAKLTPDVFPLPTGYEIRYAGQDEHMQESIAFLSKAFGIAILVIVLILVAQFNSLNVPLIITTTVLLSLVGVLVGLILCKQPFGVIMTGIGVVSLAGVVVNNAIVLLDYTQQLQRSGMALIEAAVEAGATRLRPVLLTATTTILGLVPMATGISFDFHKFTWATRSESSEYWASMAIAVIFGLGFATILTLVLVPSLYVTSYRFAEMLGLHGKSETEEDV